MSARRLGFKRIAWSLIAGLTIILATLIALYQLSYAATHPQSTAKYYIPLIIIAALGLTALTGVIGWQIIALLKHLSRQRSGLRLTLSFALSMLTATLLPISIIAFFSWQFLSYNLGQTFNSRVSGAEVFE